MTIILFDGHCNLCNAWVKFVVKRDSKKKIKFAPLQSEIGKNILDKNKIADNYNESLVLLRDGNYFIKSTAAIKIFSLLDGWEKHLKYLIIIPVPIRDFFYSLVAKYRYKFFGKVDTCIAPSEEISERFLN